MAADYLDWLEPELGDVIDSHALPTRAELEAVCAALRVAARVHRDDLTAEIRA